MKFIVSLLSPRPRWRVSAVLAASLALAGCGGEEKPAAAAPAAALDLQTPDQRVSYGIGYNVGSSIARQGGLQVDLAAIRAGLEDGLGEAEMRVAEADLKAAFVTVQERANAEAAKAGEANQAAAQSYLEKNRARSGVKVTESGLQYEVLKSGNGPKPKLNDTVEVHYHGTLADGTVFDSSVERGEPISFPVSGVIPGWTEALQLMSVGDKWRLHIPPSLAYGPRQAGKIPPNSALIFDVELLSIK